MTRIVLLTARDDFARRVYHAADGNLLVLPAQPVPVARRNSSDSA